MKKASEIVQNSFRVCYHLGFKRVGGGKKQLLHLYVYINVQCPEGYRRNWYVDCLPGRKLDGPGIEVRRFFIVCLLCLLNLNHVNILPVLKNKK